MLRNRSWFKEHLKHKALLAFLCIASGNAIADQPLWEAGAGVAYIDFPDYRGSDQRQSYVLPVPYLVYRGNFLKIERERVRGLLLKSDKVELDISLNGTVPVKSSDNQARHGMPDLDPTLEIGPSLNLSLLGSKAEDMNLDLRLPLRPVFASNFSSIKNVGWVFQPRLNLDMRNVSGLEGWNVGLLAGPVFADSRYHQYLYGVDPAYATSLRPSYQARGGYAGAQFATAVSKRFQTYWVGAFLKLDSLNGAVFADSPLVKTRKNIAYGVAISWILDSSKTMVKDDE